MNKTLYHAGPKGLTELKTDGELTPEAYAEAWTAKWGDAVANPWSLMGHPATDEICFFESADDAADLADRIGGQVYRCEVTAPHRNNEGVWAVSDSADVQILEVAK